MKTKSKNPVHDEKLEKKKVYIVIAISFILGFSQALLAYVMSTYFKEASGTNNVGVFYMISYVFMLFLLLNLHKPIKKFGKSRVFIFTYLIKVIAIIALMLLPVSWSGSFFLMIYIVTGAIGWVSLDIILESFSEDKVSGRIRGMHLAIVNTGFILAPFISMQLLENYNFSAIFLVSFLMHSLAFLVGLVGLRSVKHDFNGKVTIGKLLKKVFKRKNVMRAYYISFILDFFYALSVIYTPLYLLSLGFDWGQLGIILTVMLIPFLIFQYPVGFIADKKTGEKEFIIFSIFVMGIFMLIFYFMESSSIFVWAAILFGGRIGAALIEILRDAYFYKRIDGHDVDVIDFYRTARPMAYILATVLSTITLIFFPMKTVFLLIAIVVLSALYPAFRLVDNQSEEELTATKA